MDARWTLGVTVALALGVPGVAAGHDGVADHLAMDVTAHDTTAEPAMARRTQLATAADASAAAAVTATHDEHVVGRWGPLVDWPVVAIHAAVLPNRKVLAYASSSDVLTDPDHTFTQASVWNPARGTHTRVDTTTGFNVFCSGAAHLPNGALFLAGGNKNANLDGIAQTHVFNHTKSTWLLGRNMAAERWYPSVTPLRNGEMLISGGGPDVSEVRTTGGRLRALSSAALALPQYPWFDVAPDGRAFYSGPEPTMRALDTSGRGAWQSLGTRDPIWRDYGSRAMFDVGKILVAGGYLSSADSRVIDLNGTTPSVSPTDALEHGRRQHNLTVLADGSVLATGGNSSGAPLVDVDNGVYAAELWNQATGTWRTVASEQATRQYHSTALLLPDARVLSAGGGICGACDAEGYLAKNAQVFTPPYLYRSDGSGRLAPRPVIAAAPAGTGYGAQIDLATANPGAIGKVALVRLGSVTHSTNMEQRYVPLAFTATDGAVRATTPPNANLAPPGYYMLFIVNADGVPSVAKMLRLTL